MKFPFLISLISVCSFSSFSQFNHADSLRGGYGNTRNWWNLTKYDLSVTFHIDKQEISGNNIIYFNSVDNNNTSSNTLQFDLQEPLIVDSVLLLKTGEKLNFTKDGNAYFVTNASNAIQVFYHGKPKKAVLPPWNGGLIWSQKNGKPWVSVACQGIGASIWFPCKDSQYDEPEEGVMMHYTVPEDLVCVSNGRFVTKTLSPNKQATYTWEVHNPINNYCMIPYIGDYVNMHEHYTGEKGVLELDYWVLRGYENQAKSHFDKDVPRMLKALEYWFGPYPFYEDGYKLVHAPHLGMEHQSAIAYGNNFKNGYMGKDLSESGGGMLWDFIIVHESGHEWFGNNITSKDIADMWIHEGFTCYSETLFTEFWYGKETGDKYLQGLRKNIANDKPIIGHYGVQNEGSGDMYYKGANMLHTIRTLVGNDSLFRHTLRKMNETFHHQTVTTEQIEQFLNTELKYDCSKLFDRYLRNKYPPILHVKKTRKGFLYYWIQCEKDFNMELIVDGKKLACSTKKALYKTNEPKFNIDKNLYIFFR